MSNNQKIKQAREQLGLFIRNRREEMGATAEQLADHVGVTLKTILNIESGRFAWDIDLHHRILAALEIKPYFYAASNPMEEDYTLKRNDDPERYHGFYIVDNILLHPGELGIIKLTNPRVFIRFEWIDFRDYSDFKLNQTELQWLDPDDKPETQEEIEHVMIDLYNFFVLYEREEDKQADERNFDLDYE